MPYSAQQPPAPVPTAPVDGTEKRKVIGRNAAKSLALLSFPCLGDGSLPAHYLRAAQSMTGKTSRMTRSQAAQEEGAQERHPFSAA